MKNSSSRILTTHIGSLVRPTALVEIMRAKESGQSYDREELAAQVRDSTRDVVQKQLESGVDIPSDGEYGKPSFSGYVNERLSGFELRPRDPNESPLLNWGRDRQMFREFYEEYEGATGNTYRQTPIAEAAGRGQPVVCTSPITYQGHAAVQSDIDNFKAALAGKNPVEAFIPAVAPGTIELQRKNEYYSTDEEYLFAIADAMREEYKAIVDSGFLLQIDDPRVVTQYGMPDPAPAIEEYRKFAELRVEAINHALEGIPEDRVRYHLCWGSWHGPHVTDVPLKDIVDIILRVRAGAYCVEAANPRHGHEWQVWENVKLPDGKILIPGVVAHTTNLVEHPELVAQRIATYARMLGRENVIAGTDCGFSQGAFTPRVHSSIMWAKLQALTEGAALATERLW
ncbi:MAG: cobalamin-independent methionine synthase II family protein [Chloroflexi bacterium]|nr:cobalamin-independent methionine synthase II family protein [Chloroflexota bacterium]